MPVFRGTEERDQSAEAMHEERMGKKFPKLI